MHERATGIILRTRPLTETSLIVHWLTPEHGRLATVAKGARRPKSTFRGKLDLFYEAELSFTRSRASDLHNLREVVLHESHAALRGNLGWLQQASYFVTLIEQTTETETPLPHLHHLMQVAVRQIQTGPPTPLTVFTFELRLLSELGIAPDWDGSTLSLGARQVGQILAAGPWALIRKLKLSEAQRREVSQFLHGHIARHLERNPPPGRNSAIGAE